MYPVQNRDAYDQENDSIRVRTESLGPVYVYMSDGVLCTLKGYAYDCTRKNKQNYVYLILNTAVYPRSLVRTCTPHF